MMKRGSSLLSTTPETKTLGVLYLLETKVAALKTTT